MQSGLDEEGGGDFAFGDNGAPIDKDERAALDALREMIDFTRGGKPPRKG